MTTGTVLAIAGAALAAIMSGIGSALGVGMAGRAAAGLTAEDPEKFGKALLLQLLPATQGIYGLLVAFLVLLKIGAFGDMLALSTASGWILFASCMPMAVVGLISAVSQAKVSVAGIACIAKRPEASGKAMILAAMVELYAIFALLIFFLGGFIPEIVLA